MLSRRLPGVATVARCSVQRLAAFSSASEPTLSYLEFENESYTGEKKTAMVLHGLLGSSTNWKTFIASMSQRMPNYRWIVPSLRNHGESTGFSDPHTLAAAAADVASLALRLGTRIDAVVGHSLGGKIALQMLQSQVLWPAFASPSAMRARAVLPPTVERHVEVVLLDTVPGTWDQEANDTDPDSILRIMDFLNSHPLPVLDRRVLVKALAEAGFSDSVQQWLSANLRPLPRDEVPMGAKRAYTWKFDPKTAKALLDDHLVTDLWDMVARPPSFANVNLVLAEQSSRWSCDSNRRHLKDVPRDRLYSVDAGHWVHVDNPEETTDLLAMLLGKADVGSAQRRHVSPPIITDDALTSLGLLSTGLMLNASAEAYA